MSDPVSKAEIEDVLSSIRRLVSDDARVKPRQVVSREPAAADRLVLTQSLRVAAPEPESDAATDDAPWRDPDATLFGSARTAGMADAGAERDEAPEPDAAPDPTGNFDDDGETDGGEDAGGWSDDAAVEAGWVGGDAEGIEDEPGDLAEPQPEDGFADGSDEPVAMPEEDETSDEEEFVAEETEDEAWDVTRVGTLTAKIQALEAAIGRTRDRWEPDGDGGDDYAGTPVETIEWEDHGNSAGPAEAERPRPRPEVDDAPDFAGGEDTFLDEESLRELVAEIVRQELMGALGERITRNVRKLVRREIHRALTAQELD